MTKTALPGAEDWSKARRLHKKLARIRATEAEVSAEFDVVIGHLNKLGFSGYAIAQELGMERPTVARILKRANGE